MTDFFATPAVQAGASIVVLCILIAAGFYLVSSYRDCAAEDREYGDDALFNFREMHLKGDINDEEFRTIQARTHRQAVGSIAEDASTAPEEESPNT